jgi:flagellar hook assembly protein FlgD
MPEIKDNYCYPNPFNPDNQYCTIRFSGSDPQACYAKIFDISGKQIKLIREKDNKTDIERVIYWDGTNSSNSKVHDGIYIYEITSGSGLKISGKILISR